MRRLAMLDGATRPAQDGSRSRHLTASPDEWQTGGVMLNPGDKAPDFVGRDHNGNTVKLSDFKGKPVVLWFFPKADTPG
jgi:peroxiredoxin